MKICLNAFTLHYGITHWLFQNSITRAWYEDRAQKYCTLCIMHARWCFDHARWFRYRNCIVRFLYILRAKMNISITLCFVLCPSWIVYYFGSRIDLIHVMNCKWYTLYHGTLHFYNAAIRDLDLHRFIVIYRLTIENYLIWQSIFIIFIAQKFPPDIRFILDCRLDELINVASDFDIISDLVVKFDKARP